MSKRKPEIITVVIESQQQNTIIGRHFYRYILEELKIKKGES